ncbi:hypothetical protein BDW71DRAFT_180679 [Aspergillus fruticulosus]
MNRQRVLDDPRPIILCFRMGPLRHTRHLLHWQSKPLKEQGSNLNHPVSSPPPARRMGF